jgi:hypothetical protein
MREGPRVHRRARRHATASLLATGLVATLSVSTVLDATLLTSATAGATGILPPSNPPANIAPSSADWLQSVNAGRSAEGLAPMNVSESAVAALPVDQQVLTVVNEERIDRGLPPIDYITSQLDSVAQAGANGGSDPTFPSNLTGGTPITYGGSVWAGSSSSVLEADYYWMYDDGWGGSTGATVNAACSPLSPGGCWAHRDILLHEYASCPAGPPVLSMGAAQRGGSIAALFVSSCGAPADVSATWGRVSDLVSSSNIVGVAPLPNGTGYWEAEANGKVGNFGTAQNDGSLSGPLNAPIVGIAATPDGGGYWLVASDGGVFSFGDAHFYGSTGSLRLNKPIVGIASTADGHGYWMVASDGGIFSFGDAAFHGSMGQARLNQPVVGMGADQSTGGYWEVAADGGVFSFDAPFFGSTGSIRLNQPIVGMEGSANGQGYRFVAADGGIFTYGNAAFDGSTGGTPLVAPVVGMAPDNATNGYWLAAADGGIFTFGGAKFLGRLISSGG